MAPMVLIQPEHADDKQIQQMGGSNTFSRPICKYSDPNLDKGSNSQISSDNDLHYFNGL